MKGKNSSGQSRTCDTDYEGSRAFIFSEDGVAGVTLGTARFSSIPYY